MMENGNNIVVYVEGPANTWTAIACTRSDEIQVEGDTIEIASDSATDQEWKRNIMGRKSWSLNVSWLVSEAADIEKVLMVGTRVRLHIGARGGYSGGTGGMTGYAWIRTAKVTNTRGALSNGSFQFIGDGALS